MASTKQSSKKSSTAKASSKKASKKAAAKPMSLAAAAKAGNIEAALMAVSATATPQDAKESVILTCLISCFSANGFPQLSPSAKIVWATIPNNVISILGNCVRDCINSKGFDVLGLAGPFQNLKNQNKVTIVKDLVTAIAKLVAP